MSNAHLAGIAGNTCRNVFVCDAIIPTLGKMRFSGMFYLHLFGGGSTGKVFSDYFLQRILCNPSPSLPGLAFYK